MFDYLLGKITFKKDARITLDNQGIGYLINVPKIFAKQLELKEEKKIYIYQQVGENENTLYGFSSRLMRIVFQALLGVSGVGPKMAIRILDDFSPQQLLEILAQKRIEQLKTIKGLGAKVGERILIDLNKKAKEIMVNYKIVEEFSQSNSSLEMEVKSSLIKLGYRESEIKDLIPSVFEELDRKQEEINLENVIKKTLEKLSKIK